MSMLSSPNFLRNVLRLDALSCIACALLQLLATAQAAQLFGLPSALLVSTGLFLLVYGAAVGWLSTWQPVPRGLVWLLVAGNLGWAAACVGLLAGGLIAPTLPGKAYVIVQAVTVAVLAELQWFGLRRAHAPGLA